MISEKNLHVIVLTGFIPHVTYFTDQFIKYLNDHEIDHYIVDVTDANSVNSPEFDRYITQENTVVFTFNNIGIYLTNNGDNLWHKLNLSVFNYILDHPRNFRSVFLDPVCNIYTFALDKEHVDFMKHYYPKLSGVYFSPNGGTNIRNPIPYRNRKIDVLYTGSCQEPVTDFPKISFFTDDGQSYYLYTVRYLLHNPELSTDSVIDNYLSNNSIPDMDDEKIFFLKAKTAPYIENIARRNTKLEGIKALDELGINVEIYGAGWVSDEYPFSDNIHIHDWIDIHDLMPIICDSKITLCFMPWFKKGSSEKVFDAMLNGSLCVTDYSEYLGIHYVDGQNIVYFDLNNPAQMAADIKWLLENPKSAEQIAKNGFETASRFDTWNHRFDFVLKKMLSVG